VQAQRPANESQPGRDSFIFNHAAMIGLFG
jgi:hypothetical protein